MKSSNDSHKTTSLRYPYLDKFKESVCDWAKLDDSELWEAFKMGHEGAFNHIYSTYFVALFKYGHRISPSRELVMDCIQDLFIDLREKGVKNTSTNSIKYFLFGGLKNKILSQLRKKKEKTYNLDVIHNFMDIQVSYEVNLINQLVDQENKSKLQHSLKKLPKRQREAIFYFYNEGFSYKQLAEIMRLNHVKSARNLIYKAVMTLKQLINP